MRERVWGRIMTSQTLLEANWTPEIFQFLDPKVDFLAPLRRGFSLHRPTWAHFGRLWALQDPSGGDFGMRKRVWGRIMTSQTLLEVNWTPENFSIFGPKSRLFGPSS